MLEGLQADLGTEPVDPACPKLHQYLMASMGSLPNEVLRILFLDSAHRLISDEQLQNGSARNLELYPRTIFRRAMEHGATGIILVHNHPSGDPTPSESDMLATRRLCDLGLSLEIAIVDHIIVTATRACRVPVDGAHPVRSLSGSAILRDNPLPPASEQPDDRAIAIALQNARRASRRRSDRRELFGARRLFGEPAWDMLIDLLIHRCQGRKVATSALCMASSSPSSTALRLINRLCEAGFVLRTADPHDGRRQFVELTPHVEQKLLAYFSSAEV